MNVSEVNVHAVVYQRTLINSGQQNERMLAPSLVYIGRNQMQGHINMVTQES